MKLTIEEALQQAMAAYHVGKLQEAERLYRAILQSEPLHPDANHNLGLLAVSVNKADAALPLFKTALKANPKKEQFWLSYIDALIKEKQFDNAKEIFDQAKNQGVAREKINVLEAQLTPTAQVNEPKLAVQKKSLSFSEKRKKLAGQKKQKKKKKQSFKGINPSKEEINSLLQHYQNGRYGDAEQLAVSITQEFPKHPFGWKVLGSLYRQSGRDSEAVNANQKSVALSPSDAAAHSNLGITLKELGRLEEAESSYRQAIALKPDLAEAHSNLGNTLQELSRSDEAEASCRQAIALKPDYAEAHSNLGITLQELGRLDEAEASYNQAIALKPDFAEAHSNLGITLQKLGRLGEAEASWNQAISLKPDYAEALTNRWLLLFSQKRYEAALRDADLCISKGATQLDLTSLYALGRIEEIYKRIEKKSKIDGENISIAAFAAFFSESEKKSNAYNFCPNPMDFIHVSNVASHLRNSTEFVREVIGELNNVKTIWEPHGRTARKGFVTDKRFNLFANSSGKLAQLKAIILDEIDAYYLKFREESCLYIKKWPSEKFLNGWHVVLKQQGYNTAHIHPSGWLSGVIYLKVVPSLGKDEGAIEFSLNGEQYSNINSPKLTYQPELGSIVFFPSSLHHRTIPFTTDANRIIVSFDLMPETAKH